MSRNALVVPFLAWSVAIAAPPADQNLNSGRFDALFAPLCDAASPGLAVLIRKNGRAVFERGFGVRDLQSLQAINAKTDFRLASFTKQFTAMATMLLVHDGKLRYNETLTEIFPNFPAYGRAITIRNLLTHTSGLPDYETLMEQRERTSGPIWTAAHQIHDGEVLDLLLHESQPKFAPGTSWAYSNSGYVLLGVIAAKVSGKPFHEFLHDRIFGPLGMDNTLAYVNGKNTIPNRAYGYTKDGTKFVDSDQSSTSATLGDGGVYANLEDLAKWDNALQNHTLLSEENMKAALTPVRLADGSAPHWPVEAGDDNLDPGKPVSYGFGWFLDPYQGHSRMWHTGTTSGFRTVIERFTQDKLTIVILCNRTDLDANRLALQAAEATF